MVVYISLKIMPAILGVVLGLVGVFVSMKMDEDSDKASPFECGFDPGGGARVPFSLRYFLLAVYFLIFDIEVIYLLPLPLEGATTLSEFKGMGWFLFILLVGLAHEWREGSLNWVK